MDTPILDNSATARTATATARAVMTPVGEKRVGGTGGRQSCSDKRESRTLGHFPKVCAVNPLVSPKCSQGQTYCRQTPMIPKYVSKQRTRKEKKTLSFQQGMGEKVDLMRCICCITCARPLLGAALGVPVNGCHISHKLGEHSQGARILPFAPRQWVRVGLLPGVVAVIHPQGVGPGD